MLSALFLGIHATRKWAKGERSSATNQRSLSEVQLAPISTASSVPVKRSTFKSLRALPRQNSRRLK